VIRLSRRVSAALLAATLVMGQAGVCSGWMPTAEARMACCEDGACPMHQQHDAETPGTRVITQAEADSCCASCETRGNSQPTQTYAAAAFHAVIGGGVVLPDAMPARVLTDGWRTAPLPPTPVPKHVLLSVFLV
jgi:hypothetical protein